MIKTTLLLLPLVLALASASEQASASASEQASFRNPQIRNPLCSEPGCKTFARRTGPIKNGGRMCHIHGGGARCTWPGCEKQQQKGDKCYKHAGATSKVEHCPNVPRGHLRGYCHRHRLEGCPDLADLTCSVEECQNQPEVRGLCKRHAGLTCGVEGCTKLPRKRGLCYRHRSHRMQGCPNEESSELSPQSPAKKGSLKKRKRSDGEQRTVPGVSNPPQKKEAAKQGSVVKGAANSPRSIESPAKKGSRKTRKRSDGEQRTDESVMTRDRVNHEENVVVTKLELLISLLECSEMCLNKKA